MASIYDSGMGGDRRAMMYGNMADDDYMEQRKRQAQQAGYSGAMPIQAPVLRAQQVQQIDQQARANASPTAPRVTEDGGVDVGGRTAPSRAPARPAPTFQQLAQSGRARPNPPAPAPRQMPQQQVTRANPTMEYSTVAATPRRARTADTLPDYAGGDQLVPLGADSIITTRAEPGQTNPWTGQMTPYMQPVRPVAEPSGAPTGPQFDVGSYMQQQLTGMPGAATAPTFTRSRGTGNIAGLMGLNTAASGMPGQAYNPGQFDYSGYQNQFGDAVAAAGGMDLAPSMYAEAQGQAKMPGLYGSDIGASRAFMPGIYADGQFSTSAPELYAQGASRAAMPSIYGINGGRATAPGMYGSGVGDASGDLNQNIAGLYGRGVGRGNLPNFTQQALSAGGLDVAGELANLYRSGSRGVSDEVSRSISDAIANPSAYTNAKVQEIYGQLGQNVDDEFAQRETALREEMAGRGLSDSSIQGGRLQDLNVAKRSAKTSLANELGQAAARDFAGARSAAIGQGMQRDAANLGATTGMLGQLLGTQQAGANLGFQNLDAELGLDAAARARQAQSFGQDAQALGMRNQMNQQDFDRARGRYSDQLAGQQFQNQLDQFGFDQQRAQYGDQLAGQQFQRDLDLDQFNQNRARFGDDMARTQFQSQIEQANFDRQRARYGDQLQGAGMQNQLDQYDLNRARARYSDDLSGQQFRNQLDQAGFDRTRARFGDQLNNAQFQQGIRQQNVQNQMARGNQALDFFNANAGFGQQNFQNQLGLAQANDQLTGNRFGRELQGLDYLTGLDQQDFANDMARSQFGLQSGDQRYNQGLGYLDRMMGYGQQAFNNDMQQAEFNRMMQSDQDRLMLQMLGLGG